MWPMLKSLVLLVILTPAFAMAEAQKPARKTVVSAAQLEKNKLLVRRFYAEVWNKGNLDVADEVFTQDYVRHDPGAGQATPGPEGQKQIAAGIRKAFPDVVMTIDFVIGERDMVAARWTITGTNKGDLPMTKATGKQVTFSGINTYRFDRGKVVELWNHRDDLSMLMQLGVVKPPAPPNP